MATIKIYDDEMNLVAECWVDVRPKEVICYGDYWYQIDDGPPMEESGGGYSGRPPRHIELE